MSADNGIYILHTADQYRVVHTQAIDNLYWSHVDGMMDAPVSARILEIFGKSRFTRSKKRALFIAYNMLEKLDRCEYGIQLINVDSSWDDIINEGLRCACQELKYLTQASPERLREISELENLVIVYGIIAERRRRAAPSSDE